VAVEARFSSKFNIWWLLGQGLVLNLIFGGCWGKVSSKFNIWWLLGQGLVLNLIFGGCWGKVSSKFKIGRAHV
jgi:hypothetical protein